MTMESADHQSNNNTNEDPGIRRRALEHLSEILEFISYDRKAAYMQALRDCPDLVQTESDPLKFLRFEKFNSWSASERLVTYWSKRNELFGGAGLSPDGFERKGALSEEEVSCIASGLELMMVTTGNILIYDRTSSSDTLIDPCMQAGKGPRVFIRGFTVNLARARVNQETRLLIEHAFPIPQIEEMHLAYIKEKNQNLWQYIVPFGLQQAAGLVSQVKVHNCDSVEELAESFSRHGIPRSSLPVAFGGYYNQDVNFVQFLLDNGYPAAKLGESLVYEPHAEESRSVNNKSQKRMQDDLDNLVDYFISKAPTLPDIHDMNPLGFLQSFLSAENSNSSESSDGSHSLQPKSPTANLTVHTSSRTDPLWLPSDEDHLSEYQCLFRQHVEYFEATNDDVATAIRGRNKPLTLGQVGIRCRHCSHLPRHQRQKAATYFPTKLDRIYQPAVNLARIHLMDACDHVPTATRQEMWNLSGSKSFMGTGKDYWCDSAQICGVVEVEGMLRFRLLNQAD